MWPKSFELFLTALLSLKSTFFLLLSSYEEPDKSSLLLIHPIHTAVYRVASHNLTQAYLGLVHPIFPLGAHHLLIPRGGSGQLQYYNSLAVVPTVEVPPAAYR